MIRNYIKIAWRNLLENKGYSLINIGGLAAGMAVVILIGLWIFDELSYDKNFDNYNRIAQVMQHNTSNGQVSTDDANPPLMAQEIRNKYGSDFEDVLQSSYTENFLLEYDNKKIGTSGKYFEPGVTEMLSLKMIKGTRTGLRDPYSILLCESAAKIYFGETDPIGKVVKFDNRFNLKVTGVYEDFPSNSSFEDLKAIIPWKLFYDNNGWIQSAPDLWTGDFTQTYAQLSDKSDFEKVSAKIKNVKYDNTNERKRATKPEVFLLPMSKWHLYSEFENGVNIGGRIQYVWLFGLIGLFILFLACINFMNLSTAQSEKRAMEVGVRKALGSIRKQLILQFLIESIIVTFLAALLSLLLAQLGLSFFNEVADKDIRILWLNPWFWLVLILFSLLTGILAGGYPALYLSSFKPVEVLKGTFNVGRFASIPRKVLVVTQFSISIILIIGTIIVYSQIQFAKNRSVGYEREGMITIPVTREIHTHFESIRNELKASGAVLEITQSSSPTTDVWRTTGGFNWKGKDPNLSAEFPINGVTFDYGKTVNWRLKEGRDFSRDFSTDSVNSIIVNETAVKYMGLKEPIGEIVRWGGDQKPFTIVGVVEDMIVESPYEPIRPMVFNIAEYGNIVIAKLNPAQNLSTALSKVEEVFKKYSPNNLFDYSFVNEEYAMKFGDEERIGQLAGGFSAIAILISCLGLFGLASFIAEQRTREIGIRKVLGASVPKLWKLLSKEFAILVIISCIIAVPIAWYFMNSWLENYTYRTNISLWIFVVTIFGSFLITMATTSYQAVRAARANPIKSLRSE